MAVYAVILFTVPNCAGNQSKAAALAATAEEQLQAGDVPSARKTIAKAVKERGDVLAIQLLRARIELAAGFSDNAFAAYRDALALDSGNEEALKGVARLGLQTSHWREAKEASERILLVNPRDIDALLVRGIIKLGEHKIEQALADADQILKTAPDNEPGMVLKVRCLFLQGHTKEALAAIDGYIAGKQPTESTALTHLELHRELGDGKAMLVDFGNLRRLLPDDKDLRLDEANLRYKLGDAAGARPLLRAMIEDPKTDLSLARSIIFLLREYDPTPFPPDQLGEQVSPAMLAELARFYLDNGADQTRLLLSALPADRQAGLRARLLVAAGDKAQGLTLANRVLEKDQTDCDALIARAEIQLSDGNGPAAVTDAGTATAQCPQMQGAWVTLAKAYAVQREDGGVMRSYEQGIKANPQDSYLPRLYANWLIDRGKTGRSQGVARMLVRSAPALMSGWALYKSVCEAAGDRDCADEATRGAGEAKTKLGIDLRPGEQPPRGLLFSRLRRYE